MFLILRITNQNETKRFNNIFKQENKIDIKTKYL